MARRSHYHLLACGTYPSLRRYRAATLLLHCSNPINLSSVCDSIGSARSDPRRCRRLPALPGRLPVGTYPSSAARSTRTCRLGRSRAPSGAGYALCRLPWAPRPPSVRSRRGRRPLGLHCCLGQVRDVIARFHDLGGPREGGVDVALAPRLLPRLGGRGFELAAILLRLVGGVGTEYPLDLGLERPATLDRRPRVLRS